MNENLILQTDSYKVTQWKQYPPGTQRVFSYFESRGGDFGQVVFFGLQYYLLRYLAGQVVTQEKVDEADEKFQQHFGKDVFNRAGWEYIIKEHGGRLPIRIDAVPEGLVVPNRNILFSIENTDPACFWLTNYLETLLVQVWYPCSVATLSKKIHQVIGTYLEKTGMPSLLGFKLHDFGYRGVSSQESAAVGGAAHLVNFMGTDTLAALDLIRKYYGDARPAGFSIPASEHSTITSWGEADEAKAYRNMLHQYPEGYVACVSDSYNIYRACEELWGTDLKDTVMQRNGTLVVRPDSGDPLEVVLRVLDILGDRFGYTVNEKGYKVLDPHIRVIQGDGVDLHSIHAILSAMDARGWSADNIAFGMGGALLQRLNRDTHRFALKCSAVTVNGSDRRVCKSPVGDPGKHSKAGRLKLVNTGTPTAPQYCTVDAASPTEGTEVMRTVFLDGTVCRFQGFDEISARAADHSL